MFFNIREQSCLQPLCLTLTCHCLCVFTDPDTSCTFTPPVVCVCTQQVLQSKDPKRGNNQGALSNQNDQKRVLITCLFCHPHSADPQSSMIKTDTNTSTVCHSHIDHQQHWGKFYPLLWSVAICKDFTVFECQIGFSVNSVDTGLAVCVHITIIQFSTAGVLSLTATPNQSAPKVKHLELHSQIFQIASKSIHALFSYFICTRTHT